jgi:hypothetical protein
MMQMISRVARFAARVTEKGKIQHISRSSEQIYDLPKDTRILYSTFDLRFKSTRM